MNLHSIAMGIVSSVNPSITVSIQSSSGYTTEPDGTRAPAYAAPVYITGQLQSLTFGDLQQLQGIAIQGQKRALYLNGSWDGVVRPDGKGGDLITLPDGSLWLVVQVLEDWSLTSGWVKLAIVRQES